jgi:hypothetical protein
LFKVSSANYSLGLLLGFSKGRQKQSRQNRNNSYDDKELNQGKAFRAKT